MCYVDDLRQFGTKCWCHLTADSLKELLRMAEKLHTIPKLCGKGLEPHLDLTPHQRKLAIKYGAIPK